MPTSSHTRRSTSNAWPQDIPALNKCENFSESAERSTLQSRGEDDDNTTTDREHTGSDASSQYSRSGEPRPRCSATTDDGEASVHGGMEHETTRAKKVAIKTEPIDNEISTSTSNNETSQQKGGSRISLSSGSNLNRENTNTAEAAPAAFNRAEYEALHARYAILCKERYGNRDLDMEDWNPPPPIPVIEFEDGRIPTVEALSTMIRARGGFFPLPGEASTSALPVASRPAIAPMRQADAEEPHSADVVEVAKKVARPRRAKAATRTRRVKAANLGQLQEGKTRLQAGTAERTAGRKNEGAKVTNGGGAKMEDDPIHTTAPEPVRTEAGPMTRSRTKKARIHGSDEDPGVREGVMTRSQTKAKRDREEEDMGNRRSKRARKTR